MITDVLRLLEKTPWVLLVLLIPISFASAAAWVRRSVLVEQGKARRGNAVFAGAVIGGALLSLGLGALVSRAGRGPEAVYVSEQDGEVRLASITQRVGRGGSSCDVDAWRLSDGRFLGADSRRGQCTTRAAFALARGEVVDLWAGRIGPSVDELLEEARQGPLPGSGGWKIVESSAASVTVRLQDDSTRTLSWGNGIPAMRLEPPRDTFEHPELGVFAARELASDCGCREPPPDCPALISFRNVAFGEGELFVGLLDRATGGGEMQLVWSRPVKELLGNAAPVFGALADDGQCVVVAGRSGGRIAAARVERQSGAVSGRWGH